MVMNNDMQESESHVETPIRDDFNRYCAWPLALATEVWKSPFVLLTLQNVFWTLYHWENIWHSSWDASHWMTLAKCNKHIVVVIPGFMCVDFDHGLLQEPVFTTRSKIVKAQDWEWRFGATCRWEILELKFCCNWVLLGFNGLSLFCSSYVGLRVSHVQLFAYSSAVIINLYF
jgi:hypothetical protein